MSKQTPDVSIILPLYNRQDYLGRTIDSVRAQTSENWELVIVDDASTDGSRDLAEQYSMTDPRVRVLSLDENSGNPAKPRNVGMDHAKSNLIAFLDSDDLWHPEKLSIQIPFMKAAGYAFTFTSLHVINPDDSFRRTNPPAPQKVTIMDYLANTCIAPSTVILDKARFSSVRFNEKTKVHEDFELFYGLLKEHPAYGLDRDLVAYRRGHESVSRDIFRVAFSQAAKYRTISEEVGVVNAARCFALYAARAAGKRLFGSHSPI